METLKVCFCCSSLPFLSTKADAYNLATQPGVTEEFCFDEREIELEEKYSAIADKVHTALHEVLGHASGKLEAGVAQPHHTLGVHYSCLEEARFGGLRARFQT